MKFGAGQRDRQFPKALFSLEFATGILNCGVGMRVYLEVP
jgi:hypothetical protein